MYEKYFRQYNLDNVLKKYEKYREMNIQKLKH